LPSNTGPAPLPHQTSFQAGPGNIGPSSLDRLPSMPLELNDRGDGDDFLFNSASYQGVSMRPPPLVSEQSSLGYSKVPLELEGFEGGGFRGRSMPGI
jgi:hypothetical protein